MNNNAFECEEEFNGDGKLVKRAVRIGSCVPRALLILLLALVAYFSGGEQMAKTMIHFLRGPTSERGGVRQTLRPAATRSQGAGALPAGRLPAHRPVQRAPRADCLLV